MYMFNTTCSVPKIDNKNKYKSSMLFKIENFPDTPIYIPVVLDMLVNCWLYTLGMDLCLSMSVCQRRIVTTCQTNSSSMCIVLEECLSWWKAVMSLHLQKSSKRLVGSTRSLQGSFARIILPDKTATPRTWRSWHKTKWASCGLGISCRPSDGGPQTQATRSFRTGCWRTSVNSVQTKTTDWKSFGMISI